MNVSYIWYHLALTDGFNLGKMERMSEDDWIRASEIADYVYCNRSWWLRRTYNMRSFGAQEMRRGTAFHEEHGRSVRRAIWINRLAYFLLILAVGFVFLQWYLGIR